MPTHEVRNQPPPLQDYDPLGLDLALAQGLRREGAAWAQADVAELGRQSATQLMLEAARLANENPPKLKTHDRFGHRIDEGEFHPAWHELLRFTMRHAVHAGPWREPREGAHVARAAKMMLVSQMEYGH